MKIIDLLNGVESLRMVMPEFQREYVWPIEDAKQLIISLFKDYPTGCLLFWSTDNPPEIKNSAIEVERYGLTDVILDGQQRLTTLYLLIKGKIPPYYTPEDILNDPRHLYFNVVSAEFQFYSRKKMESNPAWHQVISCFDVEKVNAVDIASSLVEMEPINDFKTSITVINNNLTRLRSIYNKDYPILTVPKTASIDEAIEVFDRVNSQGTKLTDAELVLTHVTGRWPQARRILKTKIAQFQKIGFDFDLDFLTRCIVVSLTGSALYSKNSKLKYENFIKEDYINAWSKVSKALDYLIPILQQDALVSSSRDINTNNVLVPLVAYLVYNDIKFKGNEKYKFLHWMFLASIWARYSGQTDQRLEKDVNSIINEANPIKALIDEIQDMRGRLEVKPDDLEGRGASHPLYRMLYIITKNKRAIDWSNGGPIAGTIGDYYSIHSHHIFPQAFLYKELFDSNNHLHKKIVNEIANRAFITRDANYSISDKAPTEYLAEVDSSYPGALKKQFIPMNKELWKSENYEKFLENRRQLIADEINKFLTDLENKDEKNEEIISEINWKELIDKGETTFVEFKSSLRYCLREKKPMKYIEHSIAKTINAFLNSEGGRLFIGADDEGNILGLDYDFGTLGKDNGKDSFFLKFDNIIRDYLGKENLTDVKGSFINIDDKDIFVVEVNRSSEPVFMKFENKDEFYVRASASSQPYSMQEALDYINRHWP
ncbi:MAG TPA: DUF262 domain-containing protein [Chitinophagaceae bacterium]|nr:DUF262 domain-containing protein [Chitinophagaceae bacterium]